MHSPNHNNQQETTLSSAYPISEISGAADTPLSDLSFYYRPPQEQSIADLPPEVEIILEDHDIDPEYVVEEVGRIKAQISQGNTAKISSLTFAALAGYETIIEGGALTNLFPSANLTVAALGIGCYALGAALHFGANRRSDKLKALVADAMESIFEFSERLTDTD